MTHCDKKQNCVLSLGFPGRRLSELETNSGRDQFLGPTSGTYPPSKYQAWGENKGHFLRPQKNLKLCLGEPDEGAS